jgi:hypothetical protein
MEAESLRMSDLFLRVRSQEAGAIQNARETLQAAAEPPASPGPRPLRVEIRFELGDAEVRVWV